MQPKSCIDRRRELTFSLCRFYSIDQLGTGCSWLTNMLILFLDKYNSRLLDVLVGQSCKCSCCTPTLFNIEALDNVTGDLSSGFWDLIYVHSGPGYQLGQSDWSKRCKSLYGRSCSGKMTCVGRSLVQIQVQVTEFYEKAPLKRDFTKILSWNWYIIWV